MALDLAYDVIGSGPPLLILHGLFGSGSNWRSIARHLAATHRVYSVDLRNHGASPWADSMGYVEMADDVQQLIVQQGLQQVSVLGHSMGGKTAMTLALRYPALVERLIVADIAPVAYADRLSLFAEAMRGIDMLAAASRAEVQQRLAETLPDPSVAPFLAQNLIMRNAHLDWRINLAGITAALPGLCGFPAGLHERRFHGPLQVIAGGRSDYVAQHDGVDFQPMFPDTRIDVIADAGHWVHADQPLRFLALVGAALATSSHPISVATDAAT